MLPVLLRQGMDDPQLVQKLVAKYLACGGSYLPSNSSPSNHLNCSGRSSRLLAKALPVNLRHREQWQY